MCASRVGRSGLPSISAHNSPSLAPAVNPVPAGEAYDKVARLLGLDLLPSGGAALERFALEGDAHGVPLSVPMQRRPNCDFSFAGLKTAVRLAIEARLGEGGPSEENRQVRGGAGGRAGMWRRAHAWARRAPSVEVGGGC